MATDKSALSSREFHTERSSESKDCLQGAAGKIKSSPGQLRCTVVEQTSYLKSDLGRDVLSSKDAVKRKRVNRIAKLKQCKLDARREQWLSQGSRCRSEEHKQVVQQSTRQDGKDVPSKNKNVGLVATAKESECHSYDAVGDDFLKDGNVNPKQSDVDCSRSTYLLGSVNGGQLKILQSSEVGESGKPAFLPRTFLDDDSCKNKRPGDPDSSASDSEEAGLGSKIYQCSCESSGNICCVENCFVPDLVRFGNENSQSCNESSVLRLEPIAGGLKALDEKQEVLFLENHRDICREGCRNDLILCANTSCASSSIAEAGPEIRDLSVIHESEDDWELAADAISAPGPSLIKITGQLSGPAPAQKELMEQKGRVLDVTNLQNGVLKPEYKLKVAGYGVKSRGAAGRAWRSDDISRPPTLPPLSKQPSFQQESSPPVWSGTQQRSNLWGPPPVPSYCPICTEELDVTDSSFFPCSCGFRLCLFCHHRISSDDGRCPGCRKIYSPDAAMKLSRTTFWLSV